MKDWFEDNPSRSKPPGQPAALPLVDTCAEAPASPGNKSVTFSASDPGPTKKGSASSEEEQEEQEAPADVTSVPNSHANGKSILEHSDGVSDGNNRCRGGDSARKGGNSDTDGLKLTKTVSFRTPMKESKASSNPVRRMPAIPAGPPTATAQKAATLGVTSLKETCSDSESSLKSPSPSPLASSSSSSTKRTPPPSHCQDRLSADLYELVSPIVYERRARKSCVHIELSGFMCELLV